MKLDAFVEKFDCLADASNAVAKIRELVLQLAAQGKLVEQAPDDEPAAHLVGRIEKHFAMLRSKKEIRNSTVEPLTEYLPPIPASWAWARLGNVVDYASSAKAESVDIPDDAWLLDLEDIEKDTSRLLQRKTFRDSPSKSTKTAFAVGDVLYGKLRPYLNKVLVADAPGYCTTEIIPIRTFGFIDPVYLCYALKRPAFIAYANSKSYGMNLPRLGTDDARRAPLPLPPYAEQKRIVAKVGELMALCDRLETQLQERDERHTVLARAAVSRFADAPTPANIEFLFHNSYAISPADLRKAILTLAVQGKLVPQDPNDQSASELLSQILARSPRLRDSFKELADRPATGTDLVDLPESWVAVALGRVMKVTSSKRIFESEYTVNGVPFFRSKEIGDLSRGENIKTTLYISPERYAELKQHPDFPKPGDLLLTSVGTIGNTWIVDDREFYFKDGNITQIIQTEGIEMRYVQLYIASPLFTNAVERIVAGTAYNALTIVKIKALSFPLPPLAEQRRIVDKVDQLMALVDKLETEIEDSRNVATKLMDAAVSELSAADANGRIVSSMVRSKR